MTGKAKAVGNFRTLISLSIGHGLVAHGYVRCRSNPDEFNARGIDRLLSELKKHGAMPATPFLLVTGPFEDDEVEQILSPLDPVSLGRWPNSKPRRMRMPLVSSP